AAAEAVAEGVAELGRLDRVAVLLLAGGADHHGLAVALDGAAGGLQAALADQLAELSAALDQLRQVLAERSAGVRVADHARGGALARRPAVVAAAAVGPDVLGEDDHLADLQAHRATSISLRGCAAALLFTSDFLLDPDNMTQVSDLGRSWNGPT